MARANSLATSKRRSYSVPSRATSMPVALLTRHPSGFGLQTLTRAPGTLDIARRSSFTISCWLRVRSSHGARRAMA